MKYIVRNSFDFVFHQNTTHFTCGIWIKIQQHMNYFLILFYEYNKFWSIISPIIPLITVMYNRYEKFIYTTLRNISTNLKHLPRNLSQRSWGIVFGLSVGPQQNQNLNNSANLSQIGKIEISMDSGGHADHDYDVCACAGKHARMIACMLTIFWNA